MPYVLLTSRPAAEAPILLGALQAEGFDARLERNGFGAVYGLTAGQFASRIYVAEGDLASAQALLEEMEGPRG